jgi:hypothetical protein
MVVRRVSRKNAVYGVNMGVEISSKMKNDQCK